REARRGRRFPGRPFGARVRFWGGAGPRASATAQRGPLEPRPTSRTPYTKPLSDREIASDSPNGVTHYRRVTLFTRIPGAWLDFLITRCDEWRRFMGTG